jgi:hypothetical protein
MDSIYTYIYFCFLPLAFHCMPFNNLTARAFPTTTLQTSLSLSVSSAHDSNPLIFLPHQSQAMPHFLSHSQSDIVLQNQAFLIFDITVVNDNLHNSSLEYFGHDDPPPYQSSIDSESGDVLPPPPICIELPEELKFIMEQPLSDDELETIITLSGLDSAFNPVYRYQMEAELRNGQDTSAFLKSNEIAIHIRAGSKSSTGGRNVETGRKNSSRMSVLRPGSGATNPRPQSQAIPHLSRVWECARSRQTWTLRPPRLMI